MAEAGARPDFLPPGFGTVGYQEFEEIHVPPAVPYRPETPGWYVLFAVLVVAAAYGLRRLLQRYRRNAYRRAALRELSALRSQATGAGRSSAVSAVPALLKRCALTAYGRERVARLSGEAWLSFLDAAASDALDARARDSLAALSERDASAVPLDRDAALFDGVERWMRRHRA